MLDGWMSLKLYRHTIVTENLHDPRLMSQALSLLRTIILKSNPIRYSMNSSSSSCKKPHSIRRPCILASGTSQAPGDGSPGCVCGGPSLSIPRYLASRQTTTTCGFDMGRSGGWAWNNGEIEMSKKPLGKKKPWGGWWFSDGMV